MYVVFTTITVQISHCYRWLTIDDMHRLHDDGNRWCCFMAYALHHQLTHFTESIVCVCVCAFPFSLFGIGMMPHLYLCRSNLIKFKCLYIKWRHHQPSQQQQEQQRTRCTDRNLTNLIRKAIRP